jgi:flagellar basal body rod protein FlgG
MSSAFTTALTALKAFTTKLDVNANNVANVNTNNFKRSRVLMQETANGGVKVTINKENTPGTQIDPNVRTGEPQQTSNVSIEAEIVDQMITNYSFEANLLTVKKADEMQKELLNIKA